MLAGSLQAVDVLMLVGNVAPIALYFLVLGLVNSHSRPCLITARSDFIALTSALLPVLLWPLPALAGGYLWWMLAGGFLVTGTLFFLLLPGADSGFVIYNISEARAERLLAESLGRLGLAGHWEGAAWRSACGRMTVHLRKFGLLRNVTVAIEGSPPPAFAGELAGELERRLRGVAQLPSSMGACLVMVGVGLLILPMWMVGRHIQDLVDAMSHLLG
jgi:hypothetical protein